MEYEFLYGKVIERCKMLSSFEGRDYVGQSGESLYLTVRVTEQDVPLLLEYAGRAAKNLQERMARMISSADYSEEGFKWVIRSKETRWNINTALDRNIEEAIVSYVMSVWLEGRKSDKVSMYKQMWEDISIECVQNIFRKMPPKKFRPSDFREDETVEVV